MRRSDSTWRTFAYSDPPLALATEQHTDVLAGGTANVAGDQKLYERAEYDGFGRLIRTRSGIGNVYLLESSRVLDELGRVRQEFLPGTGPGAYRESVYDGLGRRTRITNSADATAVTSVYQLNAVTTADEAGVKTKRTVDGLGRMTTVAEDPDGGNLQTTYTYDELDNLKTVSQGTAQRRTFEYDSLKRLRKAFNPERGTERYLYDGNGNPVSRTAPDSTVTSTGYDDLNRVIAKIYTGGAAAITPSAAWCYDGLVYAYTSGLDQCAGSAVQASYGKLTGSGSRLSSVKYEHDAVGRVAASEQRTPPGAAPYRFTYTYFANDAVASETYPSQRTVTTCYDGLGRPAWVSGTKTPADCTGGTGPGVSEGYATGVVYAPHGAPAGLVLGNGLVETMDYNARQQPDWMALGHGSVASNDQSVFYETYGYGSNNNGNVLQTGLKMPGGATVNTAFGYDRLNRLRAAMEDGGSLPALAPFCAGTNTGRWCQDFGYDERGNRGTPTETGLGTVAAPVTSFGTDNRITDAGWGYDGRGNLTVTPRAEGKMDRYLMDGEDRLRAFCGSAGAGELCATDAAGAGRVIYDYDADGRRVKKTEGTGAGATVTTYVYDGSGALAAEYGGAATMAAGVGYVTVDRLGSTRVVTDGGGLPTNRYDYLPFGETMMVGAGNPRFGVAGYAGSGAGVRLLFTGKERDAESGLDYFGARYFTSAQGRWTSPDQPFADQHAEDPQSWNLYGYVRNNPLAHVDPNGKACSALNNSSGFCQRADLYGNLDALVGPKTRFFAAASAASQELADVAVPGFGAMAASSGTRSFLESTGQALEKLNLEAAGQILSGQMTGSPAALDRSMVHREQAEVQKQLDQFKGANADGYSTAVKEINTLLNGTGAKTQGLVLGGNLFFGTDKAYSQFLGGVRKGLGHDIDFASQKDREAIGNALVKHVRNGGCDVTGDKVKCN